jgi:hypothetical protein
MFRARRSKLRPIRLRFASTRQGRALSPGLCDLSMSLYFSWRDFSRKKENEMFPGNKIGAKMDNENMGKSGGEPRALQTLREA